MRRCFRQRIYRRFFGRKPGFIPLDGDGRVTRSPYDTLVPILREPSLVIPRCSGGEERAGGMRQNRHTIFEERYLRTQTGVTFDVGKH